MNLMCVTISVHLTSPYSLLPISFKVIFTIAKIKVYCHRDSLPNFVYINWLKYFFRNWLWKNGMQKQMPRIIDWDKYLCFA